MTTTMRIEAFAKVNFTLEVFAKRVDGYHALRSVVVPISLSDTIEIEKSDSISSDSIYPDDLIVKAAEVLRGKNHSLGCKVHVEKRIPAGGGLGGGSADAAATLLALNEIWGLRLAPEELAAIGADVGSDVPALVLAQHYREPILMEGRGEHVSRLSKNGKPLRLNLVLLNPGIHSSTAEVYRNCKSRLQSDGKILYNMRSAIEKCDARLIAASMMNDLEPPALALHPAIASAKAQLLSAGAMGILMSGSGSTVFGLVSSGSEGRKIEDLLTQKGFWAKCVETCPVV